MTINQLRENGNCHIHLRYITV